MAKYKHNQPHYELHFSELPEDTVNVLSFQGEEQISRLFKFHIELLSDNPEIDPNSILNKKATFVMNRGDEDPVSVCGIINRFEQRGRTPSYFSYYAELVPKMWRLELMHQSAVYQNMDMEKLITEVLNNAYFSWDDYEFKMKESYPEMEYVVQYKETDFDFINRRCEHFGIFYYFEHRDDNDVIVFADANNSIPAVEQDEDIPYNPNKDPLSEKDTITEVSCQTKVVPGLVKLKDYNYQFPSRDLTAENQIDPDAPGAYYAYGDGYKDGDQGALLAKVRNEEIYCGGKIIKGKSDCRLFRAGYKFKMDEHYRDEWNEAEYILTRVVSQGTQRGLFAILPAAKEVSPTYENEFEAIPFDIAYRPPRRTIFPRISGIMTSKVETGSDDEYAFMDDQGRYRIKSPFDLSDNTNGEASRPVRLAQPYSGPGYGLHFPNHADTEIVWACIDGDADRPLGLGTVPNPLNSSPSTSGNKAQCVLRTAGANELTFDDTTGKENIILIGTKDSTITIVNDKNQSVGNDESLEVGNDKTITIGNNRKKTVGSNQTEKIGANKSINVGGSHTESVAANMTQSVGANKSETVGQNKTSSIGVAYQITVATAMNETVGAAKTEEIGAAKSVVVGADSTENIGANKSVNAGKDIAVSAGKKMGLACDDDFSIGGKKKGVIDIKDQLTIKCGKASITMKKNGDITIEGKKINIKGSGNVVIKGKKVLQN